MHPNRQTDRQPCMAVFLARHGERHDYELKKQGVNWTSTAERPWDPPLTANGERQGELQLPARLRP